MRRIRPLRTATCRMDGHAPPARSGRVPLGRRAGGGPGSAATTPATTATRRPSRPRARTSSLARPGGAACAASTAARSGGCSRPAAARGGALLDFCRPTAPIHPAGRARPPVTDARALPARTRARALSRRTRHIHVKVQPRGGELLTTQLYFPARPQPRRDLRRRPDGRYALASTSSWVRGSGATGPAPGPGRNEGSRMADRVLFIGWGTPVRGREERALEVFNESLGLYGRMQQEGRIESFDVTLLGANPSQRLHRAEGRRRADPGGPGGRGVPARRSSTPR